MRAAIIALVLLGWPLASGCSRTWLKSSSYWEYVRLSVQEEVARDIDQHNPWAGLG